MRGRACCTRACPAGLVEPEWLETLPCVDPEGLLFTDFVEAGRGLAAELRVGGRRIFYLSSSSFFYFFSLRRF